MVATKDVSEIDTTEAYRQGRLRITELLRMATPEALEGRAPTSAFRWGPFRPAAADIAE